MCNIVIPVDFSDTSEHLLSEGCRFAKRMEARVFLIHVGPADISLAVGDASFQYFREDEKHELSHELSLLNKYRGIFLSQGVPCEIILKQGTAANVILDYAKEKNAEFIVMGSHGRSGIFDVFVGSLSKGIIQKSAIPILVIPSRHSVKNM